MSLLKSKFASGHKIALIKELGQSMRVLFVWTVEIPNLEENREPLLFSEGPAVHPFSSRTIA